MHVVVEEYCITSPNLFFLYFFHLSNFYRCAGHFLMRFQFLVIKEKFIDVNFLPTIIIEVTFTSFLGLV